MQQTITLRKGRNANLQIFSVTRMSPFIHFTSFALFVRAPFNYHYRSKNTVWQECNECARTGTPLGQ